MSKRTIQIKDNRYYDDILTAAKINGFKNYSEISAYYGFNKSYLVNARSVGFISVLFANAIKREYGIDARNYQTEPKKEKADGLERITELLEELLKVVKERNNNAYYFTPNESIFIKKCIENADIIRELLDDETNGQS